MQPPYSAALGWFTQRVLHLSGAAIVTMCAAHVDAQTIYRIESPDGRVTFSDRQPTNLAQGKVVPTGTGAQSVASSANLPFELKQVTSKYPVTLYTSQQCSPCENARALLTNRGVPFSERTIATAEDSAQLQRLSGGSSLPFLTVGSQKIKGFSSDEVTQYLDAAGYPSSSMLPSGYKNPAATPLAPVAVAATATPKPAPKETTPVETPVTSSNPAGITF